ncbi:sn-glycerol-3-phosphate ABC transporter ATP-binding protein UgpC [Pseudanabaena sp. FACHB-2040]|uniref:ABC transporter ATP-binding protein n=1 Tax=Pseudanabaena sp. FACHB-2040 TaxID=2692859 RepID=UPI0016825B65|nr:sn-glycerol-3-phosphate ABC transporter ATP-binding protein UgpC [Pseudanabaena sp. FACHB-2040]MBD2255948.1 sn-glycerol-3-phosphate ABC transporter ATP-binding protein UgpC [Pseudanabaena sp. FACHB-2040]
MANVVFEQVTKQYENGYTAVKDLNLAIGEDEFLVLVGPSGCGKSTTLRMLAGLESISRGNLLIDGRRVNDLSPRERDIAMVFQSYALYPHMSIFENMAFSLDLQGMPKTEIQERVLSAAKQLGIEELLDRKPKQLSGGQRQRVALGRTIVRDPAVFLMDEPLSNLDAKLRVQARSELSRLHQKLGTTFVYVTHDQVEAMTMGNRIAVMNKGVLQQVDTPENLYNNPVNLFVAGFMGSPAMNFFQATLQPHGDSLSVVTDALKMPVHENQVSRYMPSKGKPIIFGIRPENIYSPQYAPPGINPLPVKAKVVMIEKMGHELIVYLTLPDDQEFVARIDPRSQYTPGEVVEVLFDRNRFHLFDRETEYAL